MGEVAYAASFFEWFSEQVKRLDGDLLAPPKRGQRVLVTRQPVGVAALITPWNFPVAMVARKASAALAAGCATVLKPSEETPLSALTLAEVSGRPNLASQSTNYSCKQDHLGTCSAHRFSHAQLSSTCTHTSHIIRLCRCMQSVLILNSMAIHQF